MELAIILVILACIHPIIALQVGFTIFMVVICLKYPIIFVIAIVFALFIAFKSNKDKQ